MINIEQLQIAKGSKKAWGWDAAAYLSERATTISSVAWVSDSSAVTISGASATTTTAQCDITGASAATGVRVTATLTLANGNIEKVYFMVTVIDPVSDESGDYQ